MEKYDDKQKHGFDWLMFKRLFIISKSLFPVCCCISTVLFFSLLIISFIEQYIIYKIGLIPSKYYQVLGDRDFDAFVHTTIISVGIVLGMAIVLSTKTYVSNLMYITWRQLLCQDLHTLYFSGINYYTLNVLQKGIDNPDQRMTQDIDRLCLSFSKITIVAIISPFKIAYYTYKTNKGTGWIGPVIIFFVFFIGTALNKLVMSFIVKHFMTQEKCEGDFRFKHVHLRINSESVAFYAAGPVELGKINGVLNTLINTQHLVYNRQFWLNFVKNNYDYLSSIISYLIISIPIFNGTYDDLDGASLSSMISENSFLCMTLMYSFSQLVDLGNEVVVLSGVTHRVGQLIEKLNSIQEEWDLKSSLGSSINRLKDRYLAIDDSIPNNSEENIYVNNKEFTALNTDSTVIETAYVLTNATICTPGTPRILIKGLNLDIKRGNNLLIMGPSSCGKTSLLRVLRGLWSLSGGSLSHNICPGTKASMFLPQKPILTNGSLMDQIMYPLRSDPSHLPDDATLAVIEEHFDRLLMQDMVQRCGGLLNDPQWNWDDVLSPGEMQRISFLRLFYHCPQFALLDEATSAVSFGIEDIIYAKCLQLGITIISVGHRVSLKKFHKNLLQIHGDGNWTFSTIENKQDAIGDS